MKSLERLFMEQVHIQCPKQTGVDLLDISGGFCGYIRPDCKGQGYFSEITRAVKAAVNIPIIL